MPLHFCFSDKPICPKDLFDGRLEAYGIREDICEHTTLDFRVLTDGKNHVDVDIEETSGFALLSFSGTGNDPDRILKAIQDALHTQLFADQTLGILPLGATGPGNALEEGDG